MRRFSPYILALCLALPAVAYGAECENVRLPDQLTVGGATLVLNGMGVREATFLNINVYVAGLYLEHRSGSGSEIASSSQRKRLIQHFVHSASHDQIADAMTESFTRSAGGNLAALQARLTQLIGMLTPCHDGTIVTYTFTPGTGLEVMIDGHVRGTIPGDDFARVFFTIFVGPNPPNTGLRRGLLGGSCQ